MKKITNLVTLLLPFLTTLSYADVSTYSRDAIELLKVAQECHQEMSSLSKVGRISSATHEVLNDLDVYTIQFVIGGMSPLSQFRPAGSLKITESFQPNLIHVPDSPGGKWVYSCEVIKPN